MADKEKRDSRVVAGEIAALEAARDRAIAEAREAATRAEGQARMVATQAVGKIKKEYTDPAMREVQLVREKATAKAKEIRDKVVSAAHGEYRKTLMQIVDAYDAARTSIDEVASVQIRPHEEVMRAAQAEASETYGKAASEAKVACEAAIAPLRKEYAALKAEEDKRASASIHRARRARRA